MKLDDLRRPRRLSLPAVLAAALLALSLGALVGPAPAQGQTLPTRTPRPSPSPRPTGNLTGIRSTPTPTPGPALTPTPIASGSGSCELIVTDDDLAGPGSVRVGDAPLDGLPNRDPRYTYIRACEVIYLDENGVIVPGHTFDGPVEVCFRYTPDDVARAGGDPARLTILYYDETTGQWVELELVLDEANGLICGLLPRSGIVALVIRNSQLGGLPNTSGQLPEITASPVPAAPVAGAAPAPAPAAPPAPPADAPSSGQAAAVTAAVADAPGAVAAQPAAPAAAQTVVAPVDAGTMAPLVLALGVLAAIVAVIVALSRHMIARPRDE